jgi:hypothetical protein
VVNVLAALCLVLQRNVDRVDFDLFTNETQRMVSVQLKGFGVITLYVSPLHGSMTTDKACGPILTQSTECAAEELLAGPECKTDDYRCHTARENEFEVEHVLAPSGWHLEFCALAILAIDVG